MRIKKKVYFYRVADKNSFMHSLYGEYFPSFQDRSNDPEVILLKEEEVEFDFPEISDEELVQRQIDTLLQIRMNLRAEFTQTMDDYAERIRKLQMLTHQTADYISKDDDIE